MCVFACFSFFAVDRFVNLLVLVFFFFLLYYGGVCGFAVFCGCLITYPSEVMLSQADVFVFVVFCLFPGFFLGS